MRDAFLRAIELNAWSPALYYYMAGCAELESYRDALDELARELEGEGIGSRDDTRWCDLVDELEEFDRLRKHGHEKSNEGATATPGTAAEGSVDDDGQRADPLIPDANKGDKDDVNLSPLLRAALTTTERRSALRRAQRARATAQHYFRRAPALAGKKKMLGRTVPFEQFALRKVAKWEARMADLGVSSLPDAVGPSPALEMAYLWNAMKRMDARSIAVAEKNNAWERCSIGSEGRRKLMEVKDDMGVWAMVQANVHRARGELAAAREVLEEHVLSVDKQVGVLLPAASTYAATDKGCQIGRTSRATTVTTTCPRRRTTRWPSWRGSSRCGPRRRSRRRTERRPLTTGPTAKSASTSVRLGSRRSTSGRASCSMLASASASRRDSRHSSGCVKRKACFK